MKNNNWIRIRHFNRYNLWTITCYNFSNCLPIIRHFITYAHIQQWIGYNDPVRIHDLKDNTTIKHNRKEGGIDNLLIRVNNKGDIIS